MIEMAFVRENVDVIHHDQGIGRQSSGGAALFHDREWIWYRNPYQIHSRSWKRHWLSGAAGQDQARGGAAPPAAERRSTRNGFGIRGGRGQSITVDQRLQAWAK